MYLAGLEVYNVCTYSFTYSAVSRNYTHFSYNGIVKGRGMEGFQLATMVRPTGAAGGKGRPSAVNTGSSDECATLQLSPPFPPSNPMP